MNDNSTDLLRLLESLEDKGLYRFASASAIPDLRRRALELREFYLEGTHRLHFADPEDMYERGPSEFLDSITPTLKMMNVEIRDYKEILRRGDSFTICFNGASFELWRAEDHQRADKWKLTAARVFSAVNAMLAAESEKDRLYYDYGDNDTRVVFTNEALHGIIESSPLDLIEQRLLMARLSG